MPPAINFNLVANELVAGLTRGAWIFLIAAGLTLIFGVLHVLNFAHGSLYLLGAYLSYSISVLTGRSDSAFWIALLVAPLIVAAAGGVIEVGLLRRVYRRQLLYQFLLMFALVYILAGISRRIWGTAPLQISRPFPLAGTLTLGPIAVPSYALFTVVVAIVAGILLALILFRTRLGKQIRAVAQDAEMASVLGIRLDLVRTFVFVFGSWLAGLAGVITAGQSAFGPGTDTDAVILAFVVVVVGGMGSISGAVVGALMIGLAEAVGVLFVPELSLSVVFVIMAAVLIVRPSGLLGVSQH